MNDMLSFILGFAERWGTGRQNMNKDVYPNRISNLYM